MKFLLATALAAIVAVGAEDIVISDADQAVICKHKADIAEISKCTAALEDTDLQCKDQIRGVLDLMEASDSIGRMIETAEDMGAMSKDCGAATTDSSSPDGTGYRRRLLEDYVPKVEDFKTLCDDNCGGKAVALIEAAYRCFQKGIIDLGEKFKAEDALSDDFKKYSDKFVESVGTSADTTAGAANMLSTVQNMCATNAAGDHCGFKYFELTKKFEDAGKGSCTDLVGAGCCVGTVVAADPDYKDEDITSICPMWKAAPKACAARETSEVCLALGVSSEEFLKASEDKQGAMYVALVEQLAGKGNAMQDFEYKSMSADGTICFLVPKTVAAAAVENAGKEITDEAKKAIKDATGKEVETFAKVTKVDDVAVDAGAEVKKDTTAAKAAGLDVEEDDNSPATIAQPLGALSVLLAAVAMS